MIPLDRHRPIALAVSAGAGLAIGLGATSLWSGRALTVGVLTVVVALLSLAPLRLRVDAAIPLGAVAVIALPALLPAAQALGVLAVGALLATAVRTLERGVGDGRSTGARLAVTSAAALASGVEVALRWPSADVAVVTLAAAVAYVAADIVVTRVVQIDGHRLDVVGAAPAYVTVASSAVLIAITTERVGVAMALAASLPLLVTRFSFERYADADATLRQTVQALGLVPELSGQAPLGHSERAAHYADALSRQLSLSRRERERVVTATRLCRLGAVQYDPPAVGELIDQPAASPDDVATAGAKVLRDAGFPTDVADLIEVAKAGTNATPPSLEAAVVQLAVAFDELVGRDPSRADHALALVTARAGDGVTRRVAAELHGLVAHDPALVGRAVASGEVFQEAADGLDLRSLMGPDGGTLVPFVRRRA